MIRKILHNIFKRRRIKFCLYPVFIISCVFIIYQLIIFSQLKNADLWKNQNYAENKEVIRGVHQNDLIFYEKGIGDTFKCIRSMEVISFSQVNDDYCDCLDGSDEPGTNACANGKFFCNQQKQFRNFRKRIPSNKVNDGICDCCDGSDEWQNIVKSDLTAEQQAHLNRFLSPCPQLC